MYIITKVLYDDSKFVLGAYKLQFDRHESHIALVTLRKQCSRFTGTDWECDKKIILIHFKLITINYLIM